ncbi:LysR family transcriptional regulator [Microbacterium sp.]|uniref:LysR family transcriptional regulator n=1 Tax=Microbacterium sp. TaxID=51671 RepID=UPI003C77948B
MLDVHRLRVLRSVVASGSIHAAATNLGYTASAVSQHVAALQRETGLALLERDGRGVRPTAAGIELAAQADAVLARLGQTEALVADLRAGRTGLVTFGYFASAGSAWMPSVVRRLTRDFPGVRLDLQLLEAIPEDPADRPDVQLIVESQRFMTATGFRVHRLHNDPFVVVLRHDHRLADRDEIELGELAAEEWVDNDFARGWCREHLLDACTAAGFSPPFLVEAHDYATAIEFVAAGVGITVLPMLAARHLLPGIRAVRVVRPAPVRSIQAVVRDAAADRPPVIAALEELRRIAATS